jgi:hypothetical protein
VDKYLYHRSYRLLPTVLPYFVLEDVEVPVDVKAMDKISHPTTD